MTCLRIVEAIEPAVQNLSNSIRDAIHARTHRRTHARTHSRTHARTAIYIGRPFCLNTLSCAQTIAVPGLQNSNVRFAVSLRIVPYTAPAFLLSALFLSLFACLTKMSTVNAVAERVHLVS